MSLFLVDKGIDICLVMVENWLGDVNELIIYKNDNK